jgi:hypothetical protein
VRAAQAERVALQATQAEEERVGRWRTEEEEELLLFEYE